MNPPACFSDKSPSSVGRNYSYKGILNINIPIARVKRQKYRALSVLRTQDPGHRTQATGHRAQDTGNRTQATGHRTQDTGHMAQDTGHRPHGTGHRTQGTGHWTHQHTVHRT
jgi:hypothetical protein